MNNKVAKSLNVFGYIFLVLSIIVGILIMFQETETVLPLTGGVISEWSPVVIIYGAVIIITGITLGLIFKGFAEIIENTSESKLYQKEILNFLKQQE